MKHRIIRITICILLGVVTSVAVAWGCAVWEPDWSLGSRHIGIALLAEEFGFTVQREGELEWPRAVPSNWQAPHYSASLSQSTFAVRVTMSPEANIQTLITYGWPLRCLDFEARKESLDDETFTRWTCLRVPSWLMSRRRSYDVLPLRPVWMPFMATTLIYGSTFWIMLFGPGLLIRRRRRRTGRCVKCGYDLRGSESGSCPECGPFGQQGHGESNAATES